MKYRPIGFLVITLCLAFAGCAIPADAPVSEGGELREYFWQPNGSTLRYDVYNLPDTIAIEHTVTFISRGFDTIEAIDVAGLNTGRITSRVSGNSIFLTDVQSTALFPLPDGAYISKYSSEHLLKQYYPISHFLYFQSGAVAFTGNEVFTSTDRINWTKSAQLADHIISSVAVSPTKIYAGSATGNLYLSENSGKDWTKIKSQLGGPIRTILANENTIYLAIEGVGVFSLKGAGYNVVGIELPSKNVVSIAFLPTAKGEKTILAATRDAGLLRTFIGGNEPWQELQSSFKGEEMRGVYTDDINVLVTLANGAFYTSIDTAKTWSNARINFSGTTEQFTAADVSFGRAAMATNTGRLFVSQLSEPLAQSIGAVNAEARAVTVTEDGFVVASDHGLQRFTTPGNSTQVGPYESVVDSARGEFALLRSLSGGLITVGDSWPAGNLFIPQSPIKYVPITARVLEQLDSLKIDDQEFGDVFVVRYSLEQDGAPVFGTPYWIIYYSRGIGPVMIDRIPELGSLTNPTSRAVYKRRK
jgi:hypothetical protein